MRVAFVTCSALPDGWHDDHAAARLLDASFRSWDDPSVDWVAFDRVVIRSAWDYTARAGEFVAWCDAVGAQRLRNVPSLVAFNADKRYLAELEVPSVPAVFVEPGDVPPPLAVEVVVKPNISAGARDTGRFGPATHGAARALITRIQASGRVALVQPYLASVDERDETALYARRSRFRFRRRTPLAGAGGHRARALPHRVSRCLRTLGRRRVGELNPSIRQRRQRGDVAIVGRATGGALHRDGGVVDPVAAERREQFAQVQRADAGPCSVMPAALPEPSRPRSRVLWSRGSRRRTRPSAAAG